MIFRSSTGGAMRQPRRTAAATTVTVPAPERRDSDVVKTTGRRIVKLAGHARAQSRTIINTAASPLETNWDRRVSDRRGPDQTWHMQLFYCFGCMRLLPVHDFPLIDRWRNA